MCIRPSTQPFDSYKQPYSFSLPPPPPPPPLIIIIIVIIIIDAVFVYTLQS